MPVSWNPITQWYWHGYHTALTKNAFGSEAGMPQLNPEFWAAQVFWLILIFSLLYLVIEKIFLPKRPGERYASALTKINLSNKIYNFYGKISLEKYISNFLKKN